MELHDNYGRPVTGLRISVTQECNLDCIYCHNEGQESDDGLMSVEEIHDIVDVTGKLGVKKIKLTGGEPLMRKDIVDLVAEVSGVEGITDVSMTSNGTLLNDLAYELKEAGLDRINVSLDTLDPGIYSVITQSDSGYLMDVIDGLDNAVDAGFYPIKLNMVVLKNLNENSVKEMIDFTRRKGVMLQLIELIDKESPLYLDLEAIEGKMRAQATKIRKRRMHGRMKYFVDDAEVEIVRPHGPEFCMNCRRLRVTSDGKFKMCLLRNDTVDIKDIKSSFMEAVKKRRPYITEKCL